MRKVTRKVTLLAALLLLVPSVSQAKSLEDLLVEKGVITRGEAANASGGGASKVYWNKGTKVDFPDNGFTFGINTLVQTRYTFTDGDEDAGNANSSSFSVQKARIIVQGTALHEEFSYYLNGDFVGTTNESGAKVANLKDAYLVWRACDWADLKMGQFKVGVSRQYNNSDYTLQFADRSIASDYNDLGRQTGLSGKTTLADGLVDLGLAVFNGSSTGEGTNREGNDTKHTGVVNVRVNALGKLDAKEEGDVGNTQDAAVSFGGAYAYGDSDKTSGTTTDGVKQHNISVDANFKYAGWSAHAEYFYKKVDPDSSEEVKPQGFYIQGGYFIDPKTVEIAARYSYVDCDDGLASDTNGVNCSGNDNISQATLGLSYFWWAHNLKAQVNYDFVSENQAGPDGDDVNTSRWLVQLSAYL